MIMVLPQVLHLTLSIVTSIVLGLAGLLALLLAVQERLVRYRPHETVIRRFPPLMTMEKLLFLTIVLGFILLSLLLATSIYYFHDEFWQNWWLRQKTILASIAWFIFAVLLIGRYRFGWRGRKAIYGTLFGVLLLAVIYFLSRLVWEGLH